MTSLVRDLPAGPLDIVGDVHGDIDALNRLLGYLGYDDHGVHPAGRCLVFLGDLVDRGPDSMAVVQRVQPWIQSGRAQCVLGNHELNILLEQHGIEGRKFDNGWFHGEKFVDPQTGQEVPQSLVHEQARRDEIVEFFASLPLALQRDDVRVVHACWQSEMVSMATEATNVVEFYKQHRYNINLGLAIRSDMKDWQREQRQQNLNPVKVLTSGLEVKAEWPYQASGKVRHLDRFPWWFEYRDAPWCFFGHYSQPHGVKRGPTRAICVDYGVARRWVPREPGDDSPDKWRLGAVRYPELEVLFDNGDVEAVGVEASDRKPPNPDQSG